MTKDERRNYINELESCFTLSLKVENRRQFKELLTQISQVNVRLALDGLPCVENMPTCESVDVIPEGNLKSVVDKVTIEITKTQDEIDAM